MRQMETFGERDRKRDRQRQKKRQTARLTDLSLLFGSQLVHVHALYRRPERSLVARRSEKVRQKKRKDDDITD